MNLKKIDERLALFPEYLRYRLDNSLYHLPVQLILQNLPVNSVERLMEQFNQQGYLYIQDCEPSVHQIGLYTFDQWLHQNGHEDLISYPFLESIEGRKFMVSKHDGFTYHTMCYTEFYDASPVRFRCSMNPYEKNK